MTLSKSSKFMAFGIALSMAWFALEACDCDETKEENLPGFWVACVNNQPTLMTYSGDTPTVVSNQTTGSFSPSDWDCSHAGSPQYKGSEASAPFNTSSPSGPGGTDSKKARSAATTPTVASYIPQQLRDLPFLPQIAQAAPACDNTFTDVFQTVHTNSQVTRVGTCPFTIKARIPVHSRPLQVAVTPDGTLALVTCFDNAVDFISLATNTVVNTIFTAGDINPNGLAISADGTRAYVSSFNTDNPSIVVIDIPNHVVLTTFASDILYPSGLTLTPDGSQLWITSPLATAVSVIDVATYTHVISLPIGQTTDVVFNSVGTRAYITNDTNSPGQVVVVDTSTYQILTTYTVGATPADISISYGDQHLVVNNADDGTISTINLLTGLVTTKQIGASPSGLTFVH